jgi:hypothetical protein
MTNERHWLEAAFTDPNVTVSVRSLICLRVKYLNVADAAAASLKAWEDENAGVRRWYDEAFMRGSVAIVLSAFALEAAINEAATMLKLDDVAFAELDRANSNPLNKANAIARHCGFQRVEKGSRTGQHARLLYRMRSGLAHARAEWSDEAKTHADLSSEIVQMGLPLSPFAGPIDKAFPVGCMSSGVAAWAVITAENYITEYYSAAGIS